MDDILRRINELNLDGVSPNQRAALVLELLAELASAALELQERVTSLAERVENLDGYE